MSDQLGFYSFILVLAIFAGCTDILDQEPKITLAPETFYTSVENLEVGVNGAYDALRAAYSDGEPTYWRRDLWTDNLVPSENSNVTDNVTAGQLSPFSPLPDSFWKQHYAAVNAINEVLLAARGSSFPEQQALDRLEGELLFLRAMLYTDLVMLFGDIPFIEEPLSFSESFAIEKTPKPQVWENIHRDLDRAIAILPPVYEQDDVGRATQGAAMTLQLRTWLYDTQVPDHWNKALEYSKTLISNANTYGYALYNDGTPDSFYHLFITDNHEEEVFSLQQAADLNNCNSFLD